MLEEIIEMSDAELEDTIKQIETELEKNELSGEDLILMQTLYGDLLDEKYERKRKIRHKKVVDRMYRSFSKKK